MSIAPRLRNYLDQHDADYELICHPPTWSSIQTASASHIPADRIAKAVLLAAGRDFILAVLPADHRLHFIDLTLQLRERPQLVAEHRLRRVFDDCETGAVPAIGSGYGVTTLIDDSLDRQPDIYFEAGDHASLVHMSQREFARLTAPAHHRHFSVPWAKAA